MYTVNMNDNKNVIYNNKQGNGNNNNLQDGTVVQGTIVSKENDTVTLEFEGNKTIKASSKDVKGNVGDVLDFAVKETKNGVELKQINQEGFAKIQEKIKANYNNELLEKDDRTTLDIEEKDILEEELDKRIELKQLKRKVNSGYGTVDSNAVRKLMSEGMDIGKLDMSVVSDFTAQFDQQQVKDIDNSEIKNILKNNNIDPSISQNVVTAFQDNGLSFNEGNVQAISNALSKLDDINANMDTVNPSLAIKDNKALTISNLYASKSAMPVEAKNVDMTEEVKNFLSKNNIGASVENVETALELLKNEVEITKENIDKVQFSKNELANIDKKDLIKGFVKGMQNDINPINLDLMTIQQNDKEIHSTNLQIISELKGIDDSNLAYLQENGIDFTLSNLIKNRERRANVPLDRNTLTAKRQMLEIQHKLTSEVSFNLANKGIEIDTVPLKNALDEIRKLESEAYGRTLRTMGANVTTQNIKAMSEVMDKVKTMESMTNDVYKKIVNKEIEFNINEVDKEITAQRAVQNYEDNQTVANPKFKDSFAKVRNQIAPLLDNLGIESNDFNVKGASILVRNKMDVTQENLDNVLLVDTKVTKLSEEFQPNMVAKMLKDNINPLDANVDDILNYIDEFNEEFGMSKEENIVKNLIKLEKDKTVSDEELKTIKSVYRAINQALKSESLGVGAFVNSEHDLTISNLLDSSKYIQRTKGNYSFMDEVVDDNRGVVDSSNRTNLTIKEQVQKQLNENMLSEIANTENIEVVKESVKNNNLDDVTIKDMYSKAVFNDKSETIENIDDALNRIRNTNAEEVKDFLINNEMPVSVNNAEVAKEVLKNESSQTKKLKDIVSKNEKIKEKLYNISDDNLEDVISEDKVVSNIIEEMQSNLLEFEVDEIVTQQALIRSMQFQDQLNKGNNGHYQLPVQLPISSETTNLNVFIPNKNALNNNEVDVVFSLSTENLGDVQITANIDEKAKSVQISLTSDNKQALSQLENDKDAVIDSLKKYGLENIQFEIV